MPTYFEEKDQVSEPLSLLTLSPPSGLPIPIAPFVQPAAPAPSAAAPAKRPALQPRVLDDPPVPTFAQPAPIPASSSIPPSNPPLKRVPFGVIDPAPPVPFAQPAPILVPSSVPPSDPPPKRGVIDPAPAPAPTFAQPAPIHALSSIPPSNPPPKRAPLGAMDPAPAPAPAPVPAPALRNRPPLSARVDEEKPNKPSAALPPLPTTSAHPPAAAPTAFFNPPITSTPLTRNHPSLPNSGGSSRINSTNFDISFTASNISFTTLSGPMLSLSSPTINTRKALEFADDILTAVPSHPAEEEDDEEFDPNSENILPSIYLSLIAQSQYLSLSQSISSSIYISISISISISVSISISISMFISNINDCYSHAPPNDENNPRARLTNRDIIAAELGNNKNHMTTEHNKITNQYFISTQLNQSNLDVTSEYVLLLLSLCSILTHTLTILMIKNKKVGGNGRSRTLCSTYEYK
jgi:hypothetical protein